MQSRMPGAHVLRWPGKYMYSASWRSLANRRGNPCSSCTTVPERVSEAVTWTGLGNTQDPKASPTNRQCHMISVHVVWGISLQCGERKYASAIMK
eukprot:82408-Prorocentrum_minimum.AAC.1